ncbi:MAG: exosortase-associated EpsI family protein [Akkermansiaceae bacterium]|nr:exosortase-associated EpsI family protein [Akkermansiaceae bacterium]
MKKALFLPLILGCTMSAIYFLPKAGAIAQSAVKMDLPNISESWQLNKMPASQEELGALSSDTEFSKAICLSARPGEYSWEGKQVPDRLDLSIVLSGIDLNNSIHRPERCMPAQGHTILSSSDQSLKLANRREFKAKRLVSVQSQRVSTATEREQYARYNCVTYYFFVGHDRVTNNHLGRTFIDMKDRLIRGMDQRWLMLLFPCGMEKCHGLKRKSPSRRLIRNTKLPY